MMETTNHSAGSDSQGGGRCALYSLLVTIGSVIGYLWGDGLRLQAQHSRARYTYAVYQHRFYGAPVPHRPHTPSEWLFSSLILVSFAGALAALLIVGLAITKGARLLGTLLFFGEVLLFVSVFGVIVD
jgi:hypothetical protein